MSMYIFCQLAIVLVCIYVLWSFTMCVPLHNNTPHIHSHSHWHTDTFTCCPLLIRRIRNKLCWFFTKAIWYLIDWLCMFKCAIVADRFNKTEWKNKKKLTTRNKSAIGSIDAQSCALIKAHSIKTWPFFCFFIKWESEELKCILIVVNAFDVTVYLVSYTTIDRSYDCTTVSQFTQNSIEH